MARKNGHFQTSRVSQPARQESEIPRAAGERNRPNALSNTRRSKNFVFDASPVKWQVLHTMTHEKTIAGRHRALSVLQMLRPHKVAESKKVRVGRFFDGGYVMLDDFDGVKAAYSLGINDDVSWDKDIALRGIPIYQYDHTIDALPEEDDLFHWRKLGIGSRYDTDPALQTLEKLIIENGHETEQELILKCDIESAEWMLLRETSASVLRQFRQIVLEIHGLQMAAEHDHAENVRRAIFNLTAHHRVVHIHGNNFADWCVVGGMAVPAVLEVTLARLDQGKFSVSDEVFPTSLDMPCWSEAADYHLGKFEYA